MANHDPRARDLPSPTSPGADGRREPTQPLSVVEPFEPDEQGAPASLARGTRAEPTAPGAQQPRDRPAMRLESPGSRVRPPAIRADDPAAYLGAVLGSYRVIELLGKGGMGYVFRAEHTKLGREVALKLLRSDYASRRDAVARFFQEARTVNRVRHRNIVDVTDLVELDDGTTFIVMELLTGASLGAWAHGGVELPRALAVLVQICDGLAAAHQVGVVHRDLKPDNVIVVPTSDGAELVKLLDFGVAKLLGRDDEDLGFQTAAGSVIGTPAYMSPEQAGGMAIDARSDIYSLGAIMYELFSGQPVFRGRSFGEYVRKHLTEMPVPPSRTPGGAAIAPELEALILRCLDKDPERRFSHIVELRDVLLHLLGGMSSLPAWSDPGQRPVTLPGESGPTTPPPQSSGRSGASAVAGSPPWQPSFPVHGEPTPPRLAPPSATPWWVWFGAGAAAVGIGIGGAIWVAGRGDPDLTARPAPTGALSAALSAAPQVARPPVQPSDPPPPAALVEVRFDSSPSGSVFAEGHPTELCRTPCRFELDLSDGGPADRRAFVIKRAGYLDRPVMVDLTGTQREFQVTLAPVDEPAAPPLLPEARPHEARADGKIATDRRTTKRTARTARKGGAGREPPGSRDSVEAGSNGARPAPRSGRDPDLAATSGGPDSSSDAKAPAAEKPSAVPPIDPADTLDPFRTR